MAEATRACLSKIDGLLLFLVVLRPPIRDAFEAHVRRLDHKFKLGQDERPEVFTQILAHNEDPELVRWMRRMNPERV